MYSGIILADFHEMHFKKSHRKQKCFCIFLQSTHQVDTKNVVQCYKDFFGNFNALKTNCVWCMSLKVTSLEQLSVAEFRDE